jgi:hypothetical protein
MSQAKVNLKGAVVATAGMPVKALSNKQSEDQAKLMPSGQV